MQGVEKVLNQVRVRIEPATTHAPVCILALMHHRRFDPRARAGSTTPSTLNLAVDMELVRLRL